MGRALSFIRALFRFILLNILLTTTLLVLFISAPAPSRPDDYSLQTLLAGRTLHKVYDYQKFDEPRGQHGDDRPYIMLDYKFEFNATGDIEGLWINEHQVFIPGLDSPTPKPSAVSVKAHFAYMGGLPEFIVPEPLVAADMTYVYTAVGRLYETFLGDGNSFNTRTIVLEVIETPTKELQVRIQSEEPTVPLFTVDPSSKSIDLPPFPASMSPSRWSNFRLAMVLTLVAQIGFLYFLIGAIIFVGSHLFLILVPLVIMIFHIASYAIIIMLIWLVVTTIARSCKNPVQKDASDVEGRIALDLENGDNIPDNLQVQGVSVHVPPPAYQPQSECIPPPLSSQ